MRTLAPLGVSQQRNDKMLTLLRCVLASRSRVGFLGVLEIAQRGIVWKTWKRNLGSPNQAKICCKFTLLVCYPLSIVSIRHACLQ